MAFHMQKVIRHPFSYTVGWATLWRYQNLLIFVRYRLSILESPFRLDMYCSLPTFIIKNYCYKKKAFAFGHLDIKVRLTCLQLLAGPLHRLRLQFTIKSRLFTHAPPFKILAESMVKELLEALFNASKPTQACFFLKSWLIVGVGLLYLYYHVSFLFDVWWLMRAMMSFHLDNWNVSFRILWVKREKYTMF